MQRLGRYTLGPLLGSGGAGRVYAATTPGPDGRPRPVAVKTLEFFGRFLAREARIAAMLRHPGLVDVYEVGQADGTWFCAMERCDGSLADELPLPPRAVVDAVLQVCDALAYAHDALQLVHLDLKPENLLLRRGRVKVADFGISTARGFEGMGGRSGTLGYMAPEVLSGGEVDARTDVYSLGQVMVALATGRRPSASQTVGTGDLTHSGVAAPDAPPWLLPILSDCLSDDPDGRFADLHHLADALRALDVPGRTLAEHLDVQGADAQQVGPSDVVFGRVAELASLRELLREPGCTVLVGPGGMGKSTLARAAARPLGTQAVSCDLAQAEDARGVLAAVARGLGLQLTKGDENAWTEQLALVLAARGTRLLLLDTVERAADVVGPLVGRWRQRVPGLSVLLTSRVPLDELQATVVPIGPLDAASAHALVVHGARERGVDVEGDDALDDLVRRLEGWPLALELAAARLGVLTPADLLEHLELSFLRGGERAGPSRHETLQRTLDWTWALLSEAEREVLVQLSVFRDGFTVEAAEAVLQLAGGDPLTALESLRRRALVAVQGGGRLRLLDPVREYASAAAPDLTAAQRRHAEWFARLGAPDVILSLGQPDSPLRRGAHAAERANLLAAVAHAVDRAWAVVASELLCALECVIPTEGPLSVLTDWSTRVHSVSGHTALSGLRALRVVGHCQLLEGHAESARATLDEVVTSARTLGASQVLARALNLRGTSLLELGEPEAAMADYDASIEAAGTTVFAAVPLQSRGLLQLELGRRDAARASLEASLERSGAEQIEAVTLAGLGLLHTRLGDMDAARDRYERSLRLLERHGDERTASSVRHNLAVVDLRAGHVAAARTLLEAALARHRSVGNRRSAALCEGQLASVAWHEGDAEGALRQARVAVDHSTSLGAPRLVGVAELHVAYACLLLGDLVGSTAAIERARASFSAARDTLSLADCALLRGQGHLAAGALRDAGSAFDEALEGRAAVHGRTWLEALAGRGLARVLGGDPDGLADLEEAIPGLWGSDPGTRWIRAQAWRARALARVGRADEARAVAAEARDRLDALGLAVTSPGGVALAEVGLD